MHGHKHSDLYYGQYYNDGVNYLLPGSVEKRTYVVVKIWPEGTKIERIFF